ncbi:MAG: thioredoxin domain-containing protein [Deltaproteobacteria bacterium]|nr:thioredoxin domain-containing protein [Deltaproteobacteria bacterium]
MKKEFDICDEWLGFEVHPETPPEGVLLTVCLPQIDWDDMYRNLRLSGKRFGIEFGQVTLLSNSRLSLEVGEFARDAGKYDEMHEALFRSYFTQVQDIGNRDVVFALAGEIGLDCDGLEAALEEKRYAERLERVAGEARQHGITAAPTFVIAEKHVIVGAQPLEQFREVLLNCSQSG